MLERTRATSPFYTAEHEAFREVVRRFVAREIAPHVDAWDEAGEFPRDLYVGPHSLDSPKKLCHHA